MGLRLFAPILKYCEIDIKRIEDDDKKMWCIKKHKKKTLL